jgi:hypothetical protein
VGRGTHFRAGDGPGRGGPAPPTLRLAGGRVYADLAFSHAVPKPAGTGHTVALGAGWGLNTLLSAGAVRLDGDGRLCMLGSGACRRNSTRRPTTAGAPTRGGPAGGRPRTRP